MQVMLMRLMSKGEYLIIPKGTKFTGAGKLGLNTVNPGFCSIKCKELELAHSVQRFFSPMNGMYFLFFKLAVFFILPVFRDLMLSILCLLFVPEEEELYRLETLVVIVIFTVLWNNIC